MQDDPSSCPFIRSEKQYASFLRNLETRDERPGRFGFADHGIMEEEGFGALKKQVQELEEVVETQSRDIWALKMHMVEERKGGQKTVVVDTSVLCWLCVGLVMGIVATVILK